MCHYNVSDELRQLLEKDKFLNKYFLYSKNSDEIVCKDINELKSMSRNGLYNHYLYVYKILIDMKLPIKQQYVIENGLIKNIKSIINDIEKHKCPNHKYLFDTKDFPDDFVSMTHPNDYIISNYPIKKQYIYNRGVLKNETLLLRSPVKLYNYLSTYMTFIIDIRCQHPLYLSRFAFEILNNHNRIKISESEANYIEIDGKKVRCELNTIHKNINIIGLPFLRQFNIHLNINSKEEEITFEMENMPDYI